MSVVLKVGGASIGGTADVVRELRTLGHSVCVVHGAGPQISEEMERRGLEVRFVEGRRVTTPEALEVVRESFVATVKLFIGRPSVRVGGTLRLPLTAFGLVRELLADTHGAAFRGIILRAAGACRRDAAGWLASPGSAGAVAGCRGAARRPNRRGRSRRPPSWLGSKAGGRRGVAGRCVVAGTGSPLARVLAV